MPGKRAGNRELPWQNRTKSVPFSIDGWIFDNLIQYNVLDPFFLFLLVKQQLLYFERLFDSKRGSLIFTLSNTATIGRRIVSFMQIPLFFVDTI